MNRRCGGCTLCCKLLPVRELKKPANTRCRHQSSKGCAVYHKPGFPPSCAIWSCSWLVDDDAAGLHRPDRSGYVIDMMPDLVKVTNTETGEASEIPVIQVWCDPARPDAWRDPALLAYVEKQSLETGTAMLIRYGSARALTAFPPRMNVTGEWAVVANGEMQASERGSLLLDKLAGAA